MMASVRIVSCRRGRKKEKTNARANPTKTLYRETFSTYRRGLHPCDHVAADAAILVQTGGVLDLRKLVGEHFGDRFQLSHPVFRIDRDSPSRRAQGEGDLHFLGAQFRGPEYPAFGQMGVIFSSRR